MFSSLHKMTFAQFGILVGLFSLAFCFFFVAWRIRRKNQALNHSESVANTDDLIDLSCFIDLPRDVYAQKVWSLLSERAGVNVQKETDVKFSPATTCHPGVLHGWFKKYVYNNESFYIDEETGEPFENPSALQVFFKKYIYNEEYVFYYPENDGIENDRQLFEKPSVLQTWYKTYVYNPAYKKMIAEMIASDTPEVSEVSKKTSPEATPKKKTEKTYVRSNGYRYEEGDNILSLPAVFNFPQDENEESSNGKTKLQEEVNRLFSEYFRRAENSIKEETNAWGEPIPRF